MLERANWKFLKALSLLVFTLLILTLFVGTIDAQVSDDEPKDLGWLQPQNISQSGLTSSPKLVVGPNGQLFAFWQNQTDGYVVSTLQDDESWSTPISAEPPFGSRAYEPDLLPSQPAPLYDPTFIGNDTFGTGAFWVNNDAQLSFTRFVTGSVSNLSSWSRPVTIFENVVEVSALIDDQPVIHVAWVSNGNGATIQSGIYHRFSTDNGLSWSDPTLVYQSSFFRQVTQENANLNLFLEGDASLAIVFDDPIKEQTLFSSLAVNEEEGTLTTSWSDPFAIDSRRESDRPSAEGPKNIQAIEFSRTLHAFWVAGHGDVDCALYTRRSFNEGTTWEFVEKLTNELSDCPTYYRLLKTSDQLLLFTRSQTKIEIRFWEEDGWSDPVNQLNLLEYQDPFSFRLVSSSCPYQLAFEASSLFAIGCGSGNTDDIWASSRPVSELQVVINDGNVWRPVEPVNTDNNLIFSTNMQPDIQGFLHAVWTQNNQGYSSTPLVIEPANGIFYSRNDQGLWSTPSKIIEPEGSAENVSLSYERNAGRLFVVWQDTQSQQILFSQASATSAFNPRDWSEPIAIPAPFSNPSYPDVALARNGAIYVAYSVPYNDGIGIYVVFSRDDGETWTDPIPVLENTNPWDTLIKPKIAFQPGGFLHLIFLNQISTGGAIRDEFYYARSENALTAGDNSWTEPVLLQNLFLESNNILSHEIDLDRNNNLHIVWSEWNQTQPNIWSKTSTDFGESWLESTQVSGFGYPVGNLSLSIDIPGDIHLTQLFLEVEDGQEVLGLHHWTYPEGSWIQQDSTQINDVRYNPQNVNLVTGVSSHNTVESLFAGVVLNQGRSIQGLFTTGRNFAGLASPLAASSFDEQNENETTSEVLEPNVVITPAEDGLENEVTEPVATLDFSDYQGSPPAASSLSSQSPMMSGIILSLLVSGILILLIALYFLFRFIRNRREAFA